MANLNSQDQGSVRLSRKGEGLEEIKRQPKSREKKHIGQKEESEAGNQEPNSTSAYHQLFQCTAPNHKAAIFLILNCH